MRATIAALIGRELGVAIRDGAALGTALGFALMVVTMLPLGLGPDAQLLSRIAPGTVWIALLLAALLSVARLFEADHLDGSLAVLRSAPVPLELVILCKIAAHWMTTAVPLVVAAPGLGLMLDLAPGSYGALVASLLLGTPAVSALGTIGAALTLGTRTGGLLIALLVLPLYVPVLVFGVAAMSTVAPGTEASAALLMLAALSLFCLVLAPFAAAAAIRIKNFG